MTKLFLIARVAGRPVAIDSDEVESAVDIGDIVPVPRASPDVRGLAALRSRVMTVIDTSVALGLPAPETPPNRAVVTVADGHHYAILVEALEDVAPFELQPLDHGLAVDGGWARAAAGIVDHQGDPLLALRLRALIPALG